MLFSIFAAPFDDLIVDFAEDEGEDQAGDDVAKGVHIGHNAAGAGEGNADDHQDFKDDAGGFVLNVVGENNRDDEEDGGNDHDVSGRPRWFAGAVRAGGEDDEFVKNEVGDGHQNNWHPHPSDIGVDLFDGATFDPLVEAKAEEGGEG